MHTLRTESWANQWFAALIEKSVGGRNYAAEAIYDVATPGAVGWFKGLPAHGGRPLYGSAESVGYIHIAHAIREDVTLNTYEEVQTVMGVLKALARKGKFYTDAEGNEKLIWAWTDFVYVRTASRKDIESVLSDIPKWDGMKLDRLEEALKERYFSNCSADE